MTTLRQHLRASDTASPNRGGWEEPSAIFNKFIPNGSSGEGMGWWSPALPARPWLLHFHPPEGRGHSPLPPHQPTLRSDSREHCPGPVSHLDKPRLWDMALGKQQCSSHSLQSQAHAVPNSLQPPGTASPALQSGCTVLVFPVLPGEGKILLHLVRNQQGASLDLA